MPSAVQRSASPAAPKPQNVTTPSTGASRADDSFETELNRQRRADAAPDEGSRAKSNKAVGRGAKSPAAYKARPQGAKPDGEPTGEQVGGEAPEATGELPGEAPSDSAAPQAADDAEPVAADAPLDNSADDPEAPASLVAAGGTLPATSASAESKPTQGAAGVARPALERQSVTEVPAAQDHSNGGQPEASAAGEAPVNLPHATPRRRPVSDGPRSDSDEQPQAIPRQAPPTAGTPAQVLPEVATGPVPQPTEGGGTAPVAESVSEVAPVPAALVDALAAPGPAAPANPTAPPHATEAPAAEVRFAEANNENIVRSVKTELLPNGGSMRIRLDPPQLGALQVTVQIRDGQVTAAFETTSDEATRLLGHSLNQLKTVLEAQGVAVDRLHVQQAPNDSASTRSGDEGRGRERGNSQDNDHPARQEQQRREMLRRMWRRLSGVRDPLDLTA